LQPNIYAFVFQRQKQDENKPRKALSHRSAFQKRQVRSGEIEIQCVREILYLLTLCKNRECGIETARFQPFYSNIPREEMDILWIFDIFFG